MLSTNCTAADPLQNVPGATLGYSDDSGPSVSDPSEPVESVGEVLYLGPGTVFSDATVVDGVAYLGSAGFGDPGTLTALDATSGDVRWRYRVPDYVHSGPLVSDDTVYF